jgi:hypothetical protein
LLSDTQKAVVPASRGLKAFPILVDHIEPVSPRLAVEPIAFFHRRNEGVIEAGMDDVPRRRLNLKDAPEPFVIRLAVEKVVRQHHDLIVCGEMRKEFSPVLPRDEELKVVFEDENFREASCLRELENLEMRQRTPVGRGEARPGRESLHRESHSGTLTFNVRPTIRPVIQIDIDRVHSYKKVVYL